MRTHRIVLHDSGTRPSRPEFDLSRNELHLDPLPEVRKILESSADTLSRYPQDHRVAALTERIAALHGVPLDRVVVGPGSIGVLDALLHADGGPAGSTVFATPTFDEYAVLVARAGGVPVGVAGDPVGKQSLDGIRARVDSSTRYVIVAAPHNPSGATVSLAELRHLRLALPDTAVLVVDGAYAEFDETARPDAVRRMVSGPRPVVVLRSFSKAHGLAGLRIGYGVFSCAALAARVRSAVPMFAVNSIALTAAAESLRHQQRLRERVSRVIENRNRLEAALLRYGLYSGIASQGNFVWLPTRDSRRLFAHALGDGILVREYPGWGVRITVGSDESVNAVRKSLATFVAGTRGRARSGADA